jgi:diguanylate cyclase (GGDEF)-like protein
MSTVVRRVTQELRKVLNADACSILLLDPVRKELAFAESSGHTRWERDNIRFRIGEGVAGWVARSKQPVLIEDVENDDRFVKIARQRRPMSSMIGVPLVVNKRVIGVVSLTTRTQDHRFNQADLQLAVLLSAHVALALENGRLYEISVMDGLTNVYNRRYLTQRLHQEIAYSRRFRHPLTLVMVDIDWFKKINDTYGHQAGDQVLRQVSQLFNRSLREYDVVARYGGEEFALLLPSLEKLSGASVADRLRFHVADAPVRHKDQQISVTASFGVAAFPEDADAADELILRADQALYQAKQRGRNRVALA